MKLSFWHDRWAQKQTGFHLPVVNPRLLNYWPTVANDTGTVFVPLCGKSVDLLWLKERGHQVIGVECSALATLEFFNSNKLEHSISKHKLFDVYKGSSIRIFQGDFFDLEKDIFDEVSYVYDRASLIAMPEDIRRIYASHMTELLNSGVDILLVTLEYDQTLMQGPPFSVAEDEVNKLFGDHFVIKKLYYEDIIDNESRFKDNGLKYLIESIYLMKKK